MICFGCLYFGFRELEKWCLHPEHVKAVVSGQWPVVSDKCKNFIEWDIKVAPGAVQTWPEPVRMEQVE